MKKALKILVPPLIGLGLLAYFLSGFTHEQWQQIKHSVRRADYSLIGLSLFLGALSHLLRAFRWNYLLETFTNKRIRKINLLLSVGISYLMNLGIPRSGEVARAATLSKYEGLSFNKVFGTIVTERIIDMVFLGLFVLLGLYLSFDQIMHLIRPALPTHPYWLTFIGLILILAALMIWKKMRRSQHPYMQKLTDIIREFRTGMRSVFAVRRPVIFWMQTVAIWLLYLLMLWVVMLAFPETRTLGWNAVILAFIAGSISIVVSNGGLGTYPVFVTETLLLFGVSKEAGFAFSTVMWAAQTLLLILGGVLSFLLLPVVNERPQAIP